MFFFNLIFHRFRRGPFCCSESLKYQCCRRERTKYQKYYDKQARQMCKPQIEFSQYGVLFYRFGADQMRCCYVKTLILERQFLNQKDRIQRYYMKSIKKFLCMLHCAWPANAIANIFCVELHSEYSQLQTTQYEL